MNVGENSILGLDTGVILMIIGLLVLIALAVLISVQNRIVRALEAIAEKLGKTSPMQTETVQAAVNSAAPMSSTLEGQIGLTQGEARLVGVGDEELVAVIMAAVSHASSIPLSSLRIRSIKRVDEGWSSTAKQEMANQRL